MNAGGFPIDLILFGLIAVFLGLRLRSILGNRSGFEQPPGDDPRANLRPDGRFSLRRANGGPDAGQGTGGRNGVVIDGRAEPVPPPRPLPDPASPAGQDLAQLRQADPGFDPARFVAGAEQAFRLVVEGFAAGNRAALRPLLTADTFESFDGAITQREQNGETQRTEIRRVVDVTVVAARLRSEHLPAQRLADIDVRFVSEQISVATDRDGRVVHGVDAVMEISDLWTFERDLNTKDPAWRLAAAQSA